MEKKGECKKTCFKNTVGRPQKMQTFIILKVLGDLITYKYNIGT